MNDREDEYEELWDDDEDMWGNPPFAKLVGKRILAVYKGGSKSLKFETDGGQSFYYEAEGDCCSKSWFEHITGIDRLLDYTVLETTSAPMDSLEVLPKSKTWGYDNDEDDDESGWDQDRILQYGYRLVTHLGFFDIEMRNSSNGYYGGEVKRYAFIPGPWTRITEDF